MLLRPVPSWWYRDYDDGWMLRLGLSRTTLSNFVDTMCGAHQARVCGDWETDVANVRMSCILYSCVHMYTMCSSHTHTHTYSCIYTFYFVRTDATITKDIRQYLSTRFTKNSVDSELQHQIRENLHMRVVPCKYELFTYN